MFVYLLISLLVIFVTIFTVFIVLLVKRKPHFESKEPKKKVKVVPANVDNLRVICISLPYRQQKFQRVAQMFAPFSWPVEHYLGVIGKYLKPNDYSTQFLTKNFRKHLQNTPKHLGHLGATCSHIGVWRDIQTSYKDQPVLILEDDVIVDSNFNTLLADRMARVTHVNPNWDILLLGFSCSYDSYDKCHFNDNLKIEYDVIVPVKYFMGLWAYVIRGKQVIERLLDTVFPNHWAIDHHLCNLIEKKQLQVYGSIPSIGFHPGSVEISSWKYTAVKPYGAYFSDTNN